MREISRLTKETITLLDEDSIVYIHKLTPCITCACIHASVVITRFNGYW